MADVSKQQELSNKLASKLWECANNLRGNMDAQEFKNYILGLIFYRFLSHKVEEYFSKELAEDGITYEEAWNNDEYREAIKEDSLEKFGYIVEPKYLFSHVIKMIETDEFTVDYLEEIINVITESTQGQFSEDAFSGLFDDMDLKSVKLGTRIKDRSKLIATILNTIDEIEFNYDDAEFDVLGTAYMMLIGDFAASAGKKGGEFYTPANISKLVARLAVSALWSEDVAKNGERKDVLSVFDPACGSGSLLLEVGTFANVRNYYGQELNSTTYNLARMNMLLHNTKYENFRIVNCDTLMDDSNFEDEKFTIQVANPPFSLKWNPPATLMDDERFSAYGKLAPKNKADFAFVQTMLHHMTDDGVTAVLLPHGVLFRGGAEGIIRKYIIENLNYLDAVIGLPANLFFGTSIPVCCLLFKKERNGNSGNVCFIDASKDFVKGKNENYITDEHIDKIVEAYINRVDIDRYCHIATIEEIKENDYNCNIPRYVDTNEPEEEISLSDIINELQEEQKEITKTKSEFISQLSQVTAKDESTKKELEALIQMLGGIL